ncbi:conjugative transfer protein MobI(A/C) [Klebsiella variicola]|uniref:conjugative transfer protein MobI(A/C) n=1 Tax=Klebsiella variicola TaxID=244366 RepID=UPI0034D1EE2C
MEESSKKVTFLVYGTTPKKNFKKISNSLVISEKSFWIPVVCVAGGVDMNPIITAHQEIVIENSVRYIELLKSEASKILDEYWEAWKARNQLISQTTYANGGRFIPGRFAPVLRKVGSSQKLTIVWKDFSPRFKNKIEHHGVVVKPKLGGYSVSCFKNALDWELEMIQETEDKIKPIRELLAEYHQRKLADIKRLEKLKRLL